MALQDTMGYANPAITADFVKAAQRFNDERLLETANEIADLTTSYRAAVLNGVGDLDAMKEFYLREIKALLGELRSID